MFLLHVKDESIQQHHNTEHDSCVTFSSHFDATDLNLIQVSDKNKLNLGLELRFQWM